MAGTTGEDKGQLAGPDLAVGVDASSLANGDKLLGHANGEQVLLARVDNEFFAIGASCTHYGGPLAEGVLVGDTVRCPWHHACFSLRNGEALRAPALNPVACWTVERRDGQLIVTGKKPGSPAPRPPAGPESVVIIGAGGAGNA